MIDTVAETRPDRRPALIICAYDVGDSAWDPIEDLSGTAWSPMGARTVAVPAGDPDRLASILPAHLTDADCRAILLVGRTLRSDAFRVQMRAENRALSGGAKLSSTGPAMARATAPVADMVRALTEAGLDAEASSEAEDDAGCFLLYSLLTNLRDDADAPAIGLLRAPIDVGASEVRRGVKAAAGAIAQNLSLLPRSRQV